MIEKVGETTKSEAGTAEQGCFVDWSWLNGRKIANVSSELQKMVIEFEDGLILRVQALNFKGEPFLSFNPYKNPEDKS